MTGLFSKNNFNGHSVTFDLLLAWKIKMFYPILIRWDLTEVTLTNKPIILTIILEIAKESKLMFFR